MDKLKNKAIILLYIVIALFLFIPFFLSIYSNITLLHDSSNYMVNTLSAFSNDNFYVENNFYWRARMVIMFLVFIPINIAYHFFHIESIDLLLKIHAGTLSLIPILLAIFSANLFNRANQKHLGIIPLLLLSIGIFPVLPYACCEAYIAVFVSLIFFQYFYLDINLKKYDYIIFVLISLSLFNLHEMIVPFYLIILWTYLKNKKKTKLLTFGLICHSLAVLLYTIWAFTPIGPNLLGSNAIQATTYAFYPNFFLGKKINPYIFYYIFSLFILVINYFSKNIKFSILLSFVFLLITLVNINNYSFYLFTSYRFVCIYLLLLFCIFLLIKKDNLNLDTFCKNSVPFLITTLFLGNLFLYYFSFLYIDFKKELIEASKEKIYYMKDSKERFSKFGYFYPAHTEQFAYSIIAIYSKGNNKKPTSIILSQDEKTAPKYCENRLNNPPGCTDINTKTKFWDLTELKELLKENCE